MEYPGGREIDYILHYEMQPVDSSLSNRPAAPSNTRLFGFVNP